MRRAAQSLIRCLGRVISLLYLTAISFLAFEFHHRLKIVRIQSQVTVEFSLTPAESNAPAPALNMTTTRPTQIMRRSLIVPASAAWIHRSLLHTRRAGTQRPRHDISRT